MPALEESIAAFAKKLLRMERGLPSNQVWMLRILLRPCVLCMSNERDSMVPRSCLIASEQFQFKGMLSVERPLHMLRGLTPIAAVYIT